MTLLDLLKLMRKHLRIMILIPILCAIVIATVSWVFLPDQYTSTVSMYILTKSSDSGEAVTTTDLSASQMLTNDVAKLIQGSRVQNDTATSLNMNNLSAFNISVSNETTTRVIDVSVTGDSAQTVAVVANAIAKVTNDVAKEAMDLESVNVIDEARESAIPSGPPRIQYTCIAFVVGLFFATVLIVLIDVLDTRVRNPEEIQDILDIPVIGYMPVVKKHGKENTW